MNIDVLQSQNVEVIIHDLCSEECMEDLLNDVEYIYHLAGITRANKTSEYYEGNFIATKRFIDECKNHCKKLTKFIYVSSITAVGPSKGGFLMDEDTPYNPISHYGKSKMMAELEVIRASNKLPITVLRPGSVYGPRERDMFEYFKLVKIGIKPIIGFRKKKLNLIYCDDLVDAIITAGEHPKSVNEVYCVGSEKSYSNQQIGDAIALASNKSPCSLRIPHALVYTLGAIEELAGKLTGKQIFFNMQKAKEAVQRVWDFSVQKIEDDLGFTPKMSLIEGMQKTYEWYIEHNWLRS
jgi:nucleoside-diphosphate-sugar epimerase